MAEATDDTPSTEDKPQPASTEPKKALPKVVIIGGACAAGLLLMVGSGVGALMLFGGGDKEVAQATPVATAVANEAASETPAIDETLKATAGDAPEDAGAPMPMLDAPETVPAGAAADATANAVAAVAEPAAAAEPKATMPNEVTEAPAEPTTPTTGPMPNTPAPEKPAEDKPEEKKPEPESKPEPEKPPEKPAPPKPKTFAFPPAIDLPAPAADAPELTLGEINIRPDDAVFISLDGGDIAATGRYEFSVQNAQDGVAPRDWEFYLSDGTADPVVIATMSMPEKELKFKWTAVGIENATATNLRNCSLKITAGQDQPQDLALRTPQKVAPITIDLEKSATAKLPLEGAPDRSSLKLEITVKGHKSMVEPAQIELGKGGDATIYFGENQEQAAFALKVEASINARGIQVKTDPHFIVPGNPPVRLNKASIKKAEAAQAELGGLQNQVIGLQAALTDPKTPPQRKQQAQVFLGEAKQRLELVSKTVEKMTQLKTDMDAIGTGASLQFRVFTDTFEKQIDLIVTDPNAAPVAP